MTMKACVILMLLELSLTQGDISRRQPSTIGERFVDDHCEGHFQVESSTIIRTEDSMAMGGSFLNETQVLSLARCLHYCCSYPLCNTAVFDERLDTSEGGSCYLFDCGSLDDLKCQFTANPDFSSAVLDIDRHKFEASAQDHRQGHSNQLELLRGREDGNGGDGAEECSQYQFRCGSGECIAVYDTCNGIPQCSDRSDEDPSTCPASTTLSPPQSRGHVHLRPDMDPPLPPQQQQFPYQQQQGYWSPQQQQQYLGFQNSRQGSDYFYANNPGPGGSNVMNSGRAAMGPDFVYQNPQYPGQGQFQPQLPFQGYPPQQQQQFGPQQPPISQGQTTMKAVTNKQTTKTTTKSTTKLPPATTTTTTLSPEEKFEAELITQLGDELTSMEFPGFAIFTLTLGILIMVLLFVLVIVRIKQGKMGFRRGLSHDADGDFLVNGMYL